MSCERTVKNGQTTLVYRVKIITGVYDMTLTGNPAYPETSAEARELRSLTEALSRRETDRKTEGDDPQAAFLKEVAEMRRAAGLTLTL